MKYLRIYSMYLMAIMTMFFAACSEDNEPSMKGDTPPAALIGTWEMGEEMSITFRNNGTGEMTVADDDEDEDESYRIPSPTQMIHATNTATNTASKITIPFTWIYKALVNQVIMVVQGETNIWTIDPELLNDNILFVTDSEGDEFSMQKSSDEQPDTPDNPGNEEVGDAELLYGAWGMAGKKVWEFTQDGILKWYYEDEETGAYTFEPTSFRYDSNTHIISYKENENDQFFSHFATVTTLTPTLIRLHKSGTSEPEPEPGYSILLSRINDNEEYTIGPLSLIYDKKLTLIGMTTLDNEPTTMTLTIRANGKATMTANSYSMTYSYTYNENTHVLSFYIYGEKNAEYTIFRLTEEVIFLESKYEDEGGLKTQTMEYRAL